MNGNNVGLPVRTCARCHKLLSGRSVYLGICPECEKKDKEEYNIIKEYIEVHPNITVLELAKVTGISLKVILQFIAEDRIQVVKEEGKK